MNEKICVLGSAGFIGANIVRYSHFNNYQLVGIDSLEESYSLNNIYLNNRFKFHIADIHYPKILSKILDIEKPTIIINLIDSCNVKDLDLPSSVKRIFSSKNEDNTNELFIKEKGLYLPPIKVNSITYPKYKPWSWESIQNGSCLFGTRQSNTTHMMNLITQSIMSNKVFICSESHEYLFVEDYVKFIFSEIDNNNNRNMFVGYDWVYDDKTIVSEISKILNKDLEPVYREEKSITRSQVTIGKEFQDLQIKPTMSFKKALEKTVLWYNNNHWFLRN